MIFQVVVDRVQHGSAQIMPLQKMAEVQDGRFVRGRRSAQIHARKPAQRGQIIQRLFRTRVRQVEPVLEKVDAQHNA